MPRSVLTIGYFDGVHLGHRALLARARDIAQRHGAQVVAITFDQHPAAILRPGSQPPRLLTAPEKVRRLRDVGADQVILLEPSPDLLAQSAEAFIQQLVEQHQPVAIVEGEDFRFGRGRVGDVNLLHDLGRQWGFETVVLPKQQVALADQLLVPVSSSIVRWLVGHGRLADAAHCMTHPFSLTGRVIRGEQQGRTLGIPTANLNPADYADFILPPDGVYAGYARLHAADPSTSASAVTPVPAAISLGVKPTFPDRPLTLEAHLLDFQGDLYDRSLTITFTRWLRDQYTFPSLDALKSQLARDLARVRSLSQPLAA